MRRDDHSDDHGTDDERYRCRTDRITPDPTRLIALRLIGAAVLGDTDIPGADPCHGTKGVIHRKITGSGRCGLPAGGRATPVCPSLSRPTSRSSLRGRAPGRAWVSA